MNRTEYFCSLSETHIVVCRYGKLGKRWDSQPDENGTRDGRIREDAPCRLNSDNGEAGRRRSNNQRKFADLYTVFIKKIVNIWARQRGAVLVICRRVG